MIAQAGCGIHRNNRGHAANSLPGFPAFIRMWRAGQESDTLLLYLVTDMVVKVEITAKYLL